MANSSDKLQVAKRLSEKPNQRKAGLDAACSESTDHLTGNRLTNGFLGRRNSKPGNVPRPTTRCLPVVTQTPDTGLGTLADWLADTNLN